VKEGRFREDLFYRLDVLRIEVPPLRERRDDVPLLVARFLERLHERLGTRTRRVSAAAMERLLGYDWPGNVRELENVIERAVVLAEGEEIQESDLPERLNAPNDPAKVFLASGDLSIKRMQSFMERELIARALQKTGGNKTAAAKLLEISHRALLYKVKDYGLD
ncbi:MAG: sigma-54-dependent Fis family transcriptional regulator, partial [Sandaracinus sp.]|nr:sigma-54-dependent Fis family transcriptional regulator [Sandaracinus sp.]